MISLVSLIASATATSTLLNLCAKKERQASRKPSKSSKSSRASSTKSQRSSSKSGAGKSSKSHRGKSLKSGKGGKKSSNMPIPGVPGRKTEDKKIRSEKSSKSKRSKRSKKSKTIQAMMQCDPKMLKEKKVTTRSETSSKSSCSGKTSKKGSGSSEKLGEKILKAVPNSSNYKFPEGQVKPSTLKPTPNKLPFAPTGGVQTVTITNSTKARKAFKVKTSDNLLYRVNPVFGFVEPGEKMSIDVLRHNGTEKTDHLVVLTSNVTSDANCPKEVFEGDPLRELTVIPLVAH